MGEKVVGVHNFVDIPPTFLVPKDQIGRLEDVLDSIKRKAGSQVEYRLDPVFLDGNKRFMEKGIFPVWDCEEPWKRLYMTPTGDFIPCPMFVDYNMGNIKENSFEEIWNVVSPYYHL